MFIKHGSPEPISRVLEIPDEEAEELLKKANEEANKFKKKQPKDLDVS